MAAPTWYMADWTDGSGPAVFTKCGDRILVRTELAVLSMTVAEATKQLKSRRQGADLVKAAVQDADVKRLGKFNDLLAREGKRQAALAAPRQPKQLGQPAPRAGFAPRPVQAFQPEDLGQMRPVRNGIYTAVMADGSRTTLRLSQMKDDPSGQWVGYLHGPNNDSDYTGFAFYRNGRLVVFKKYRDGSFKRQEEAFAVVAGDPAKAGEAYALESGRCFRCNRTLTVPASIHRGMGPDCAAREGL